MTAPFLLIILYVYGQGSAMTSAPMETLELCEQAAAQARKLEGALSNIKTQCLRGEV